MRIWNLNNEDQWWSTRWGWVDSHSAASVIDDQKSINLPEGGVWDLSPEQFVSGEFDLGEALRWIYEEDLIEAFNYADEYGEPGYKLDKETGVFMIGDWWCRGGKGKQHDCGFTETYSDGKTRLHYIEFHYRRFFELLAEEGCETDFYDEWYIDSETSKAWRTQANSYSWESSLLYSEEGGEYLTPDDSLETWLEAVVNNDRMCLNSSMWSDLELMDYGFEERQCDYESGWYGVEDNPGKIMEAIQKNEPGVDVLFKLSGVEQFRVNFCVYVRTLPQHDEAGKLSIQRCEHPEEEGHPDLWDVNMLDYYGEPVTIGEFRELEDAEVFSDQFEPGDDEQMYLNPSVGTKPNYEDAIKEYLDTGRYAQEKVK